MHYVPLTDVWPQNGLLSVIFAALEDGGFHPVIECDPRGWMRYYAWPLGSSRAVTVWIPQAELMDAQAFLDAPTVLPWESSDDEQGSLWTGIRDRRKLVYAGWFVHLAGFSALAMLLTGLYAMNDRPKVVEGQP